MGLFDKNEMKIEAMMQLLAHCHRQKQLGLMVFLSIEVTPITADFSPLPLPKLSIFLIHSSLSGTEGFTSLPWQDLQNRSESHHDHR